MDDEKQLLVEKFGLKHENNAWYSVVVPLWDADFLRHRSSGIILDFRYLQTITVYDDFAALCRELEAYETVARSDCG